LCEKEYEAPLPEGVKPQKFDETADAAIAINKYVAASPFYRMSGLQRMCQIPLSESTLFSRCEVVAESLLPIYKQMEPEAANAKILYGDDTWLRILELMKENEAKGKSERVGIQTTGIVAQRENGVKIALYLNGRLHLGENAEKLLTGRSRELGPVIRMNDALAANWSGKEERIECCCLTHARRKFAELEKFYPEACGRSGAHRELVHERICGLPASERSELAVRAGQQGLNPSNTSKKENGALMETVNEKVVMSHTRLPKQGRQEDRRVTPK
jgi:hypothetical protein